MSSLFDSLDEQKRQRLRELGWKEDKGNIYWRYRHWKGPCGFHYSEAEAFRQLEAMEKK